MTFGAPLYLLLLVVPLAVLAWTWRRRGRETALPFDHAIPRSGIVMATMIRCAESLPAFALAIVVLLLASPQEVTEPASRRKLTNIEFCVDISGSMTAAFEGGTRYDASMKAINEFLTYREGDAFGLTFFGNNVLHWVPLTSDVSAFECAPPFMRPEVAPPWFGGTEIGKALLACKEILSERETGDRMIVLISDGYSSDLSGGNDVNIAKRLRDAGIRVFAVHVAEGEAPEPIINITSLTGGEVFVPGDAEAFKNVFVQIDAMQQTELEKTAAESRDFYGPFCIAALAMLAGTALGGLGLRYTPW